ncbi:MAG TPA: Flp pilus assembly protein CpaB [Reyranella sp.]|nr:Flp pilus assembly protein CpaB [Reyranella sp.]
MKPARLAVLGVAILAGGAAALMMGGEAPSSPPAPAPVMQTVSMSDVLVAAGDLPLGRTVQASDLRWQPWPSEAVPPGYVKRSESPGALEEIAGSIARNPFLAGEPIRREKLVKANGGSGFMAAILPSGMRAVAISIDTRGATSAGGFVLPNDRVDVLRTYRDEDASRGANADAASRGGGDVQVTETIMSNIRVLAIGQAIQERNGEKVVTGETATLELTLGQAEAVILAQKVGQLSLALRSLADAQQTQQVREERDGALTIVRYGVPKHAATR